MIEKYYRENGLQRPQRIIAELQASRILRAVYSERQLQEVMTDFWYNHFNIYWDKGQDRWLTTDFEMNVIRPHAMGKFKDLLLATAQSPAMLFYLDNHLSTAPSQAAETLLRRNRPNADNAKRKPGINENYARELMELHTLGVTAGYSQTDVQELARALTGWGMVLQGDNVGEFYKDPAKHDTAEKLVYGLYLPGGDGEASSEACRCRSRRAPMRVARRARTSRLARSLSWLHARDRRRWRARRRRDGDARRRRASATRIGSRCSRKCHRLSSAAVASPA